VARRNENVSGSGTSGSGGTNPSTNTQGPLLAYNLVVEFFQELRWNHQKVCIEKFTRISQKCHESLHEAYA
jgi:hypothetical protein